MMNFLHAKISEIRDVDFQRMVDELYHSIGWDRDDAALPTAFSLLSGIYVQDPKSLTTAHLPTSGILTTKVAKLPQGAVYDFCRDLCDLKHTNIEAYDNRSVLSLIKDCFPRIKPTRPKKLSRNQFRHEAQTRIILQRRANGDL